MTLAFPTFTAGMVLSMSLIMAIGPQNAHVLRMGLQRQHLWLTVLTCALADVVLIGLGVLGLAQLGGLSDKLMGALVGAGALFLTVYGWQAFQRFLRPRALELDDSGRVAAEPVSPEVAPITVMCWPDWARKRSNTRPSACRATSLKASVGPWKSSSRKCR